MMPTTYSAPCAERSERSDSTLVERTLEGDGDAFEALFCRYGTKFLRLAQGIVENESDAKDVLQKALLKIHRKLDTLRDASSFQSWAYRIVKNEALMELRREKREDVVGFGDLGPGRDDEQYFESVAPEWRNRGDEAFEVGELREVMLRAVDELEPKYQSPFVLHEIEGESLEEIGETLQLTKAGVKSRLHRARVQLRASLERYLSDELDDDV